MLRSRKKEVQTRDWDETTSDDHTSMVPQSNKEEHALAFHNSPNMLANEFVCVFVNVLVDIARLISFGSRHLLQRWKRKRTQLKRKRGSVLISSMLASLHLSFGHRHTRRGQATHRNSEHHLDNQVGFMTQETSKREKRTNEIKQRG